MVNKLLVKVLFDEDGAVPSLRNTLPSSYTLRIPDTMHCFRYNSGATLKYSGFFVNLEAVAKGVAVAPPTWEDRMGVSTSRYPSLSRNVLINDKIYHH